MDILGRGICAAILISMLLFFRVFWFRRVSKRTWMLMWLVPLIKLLVPFEIFTGLPCSYISVTSTACSMEQVDARIIKNYIVPENPFSFVFFFHIPDILQYVWLSGIVLLGIYYLAGHIKCRRRFACALPCGYDISALQKNFGIKRNVRLLISDQTDSPFTYGILRPVIILPKIMDFGQKAQLKSVLCHELAHIRRFDVLWKALFVVCNVLYWYHPLVWAMSVSANCDMELVCDEEAVFRGRLSPEEYALSLIGMEECRNCPQAAGFTGGSLAKRIVQIMSIGKEGHSNIAAVMVIVFCAATALFFNVTILRVEKEGYDIYETYEIDEMEAVQIQYADIYMRQK